MLRSSGICIMLGSVGAILLNSPGKPDSRNGGNLPTRASAVRMSRIQNQVSEGLKVTNQLNAPMSSKQRAAVADMLGIGRSLDPSCGPLAMKLNISSGPVKLELKNHQCAFDGIEITDNTMAILPMGSGCEIQSESRSLIMDNCEGLSLVCEGGAPITINDKSICKSVGQTSAASSAIESAQAVTMHTGKLTVASQTGTGSPSLVTTAGSVSTVTSAGSTQAVTMHTGKLTVASQMVNESSVNSDIEPTASALSWLTVANETDLWNLTNAAFNNLSNTQLATILATSVAIFTAATSGNFDVITSTILTNISNATEGLVIQNGTNHLTNSLPNETTPINAFHIDGGSSGSNKMNAATLGLSIGFTVGGTFLIVFGIYLLYRYYNTRPFPQLSEDYSGKADAVSVQTKVSGSAADAGLVKASFQLKDRKQNQTSSEQPFSERTTGRCQPSRRHSDSDLLIKKKTPEVGESWKGISTRYIKNQELLLSTRYIKDQELLFKWVKISTNYINLMRQKIDMAHIGSQQAAATAADLSPGEGDDSNANNGRVGSSASISNSEDLETAHDSSPTSGSNFLPGPSLFISKNEDLSNLPNKTNSQFLDIATNDKMDLENLGSASKVASFLAQTKTVFSTRGKTSAPNLMEPKNGTTKDINQDGSNSNSTGSSAEGVQKSPKAGSPYGSVDLNAKQIDDVSVWL